MNENREWDIETEYKNKDGFAVKDDSVKAPELSNLNLALRIKRSKAYYALVESSSRLMKTTYGIFGFSFAVMLAATAYFGIYKLAGVNLNSSMFGVALLVTTPMLAVAAYIIRVVLTAALIRKFNKFGKVAVSSNLNTVIGQNEEMLMAFFNDFLQEKQVLNALGFSVRSNVEPLLLEVSPIINDFAYDANGILLTSAVSDGYTTAELSIALGFSAYYSVLKVDNYKVKRMMA